MDNVLLKVSLLEAYLGPCWTSTMELFCEDRYRKLFSQKVLS